MENPIKQKNFELTDKGIPLKAFKNMTVGKIRKLDKDYRKLIGGKK